MRIVIISGSPRGNSITHRVAVHLKGVIKARTDHEVDIIDLRETEFPQLQSIFTSVESTPEEYREVAEKVFAASAFILVTPEYNGSYSAALKICWIIFPSNHRKVFAIATASPGGLGGVRAALQLQELIFALFEIWCPLHCGNTAGRQKIWSRWTVNRPHISKKRGLIYQRIHLASERVVQEKVF